MFPTIVENMPFLPGCADSDVCTSSPLRYTTNAVAEVPLEEGVNIRRQDQGYLACTKNESEKRIRSD